MDTLKQFKNKNSNLFQRVCAALVLIPVLLLLIYYANPWFWLGFGVLLSGLAAREYWLLIPVHTLPFKVGFLIVLLLAIWVCALVFPYWQSVGLVLWLLVFAAEYTYPNSQKYWGNATVVSLAALALWPLFVLSMSRIYFLPQGKALIVYLLCLVWAADIGAYFVGKKFGKHKLKAVLSPGKSQEGVLGGVVFGIIIALIAFKYFSPYSISIWLGIALITLISTVVGDLCISMFKRRCNLKDTGAIIPGHGGILDRLDSLIAAAPVFYLGLTYIPLGV